MKEIRNIVEAYQQIDFSKNKAALATVVGVSGSSYRRTGARMLILESGEWFGGISGGCLEGDTLKKARLAMLTQKPTLIRYDTSDDDPYQIGVGLGCNGIIDVLIKPLDPNNPKNSVLQLVECLDARSPQVLLTLTKLSGDSPDLTLGDVFFQNFPIQPLQKTIAENSENALKSGKSVQVEYQSEETTFQLLHEVIQPPIHLILHGSNYDIYPAARIGKELGWLVSVVCNPQKMHAQIYDIADAVLEKNSIPTYDDYTAVVLMSHDFEYDYAEFLKLLQSNVPYLGMLGPKKRNQKMYERLQELGEILSPQDLNRIHNPVGLDIGAATPEAIGLSIMAEINAFFSNREGGKLKERQKAIYEE